MREGHASFPAVRLHHLHHFSPTGRSNEQTPAIESTYWFKRIRDQMGPTTQCLHSSPFPGSGDAFSLCPEVHRPAVRNDAPLLRSITPTLPLQASHPTAAPVRVSLPTCPSGCPRSPHNPANRPVRNANLSSHQRFINTFHQRFAPASTSTLTASKFPHTPLQDPKAAFRTCPRR